MLLTIAIWFMTSSVIFLVEVVFRAYFSRIEGTYVMQTLVEKDNRKGHSAHSEQTYRLVGLLLMLVGISIAMYLMDFTIAL